MNNSNFVEESEAPWWSGDLGVEVAEKDYLCAKALTSMAIDFKTIKIYYLKANELKLVHSINLC